MKAKKLKKLIRQLEKLSEVHSGQLQGGFSAFSFNPAESLQTVTNNCDGANCVSGCTIIIEKNPRTKCKYT